MRRSIAAALTITLVSCGDLGPEDLVGTWEVISVNEVSVPGVVTVSGVAFQIAAWWLRVDSGGTCLAHLELGAPGDIEEVVEESCTWSLDGAMLTADISGFTWTGTISSDTMSLEVDGNVVEFRRCGPSLFSCGNERPDVSDPPIPVP